MNWICIGSYGELGADLGGQRINLLSLTEVSTAGCGADMVTALLRSAWPGRSLARVK